MANKLISACDCALTETLGAVGLVRFARGIYAQSDDEVIWRGLWATFNVRRGVLVTQPNVCVFCPAAEKLVSEGLKALYGGDAGRSYFGRLGGPVLTRPLYSLVRNVIREDRLPMAYDARSPGQINDVANLVGQDFLRAGRRFFDSIDSLPALRDRLVADNAPAARMYAISVTYLMNKGITSDEIDEKLGPQPNEMTRRFAEYFRKKFLPASA